MSARVGDYAPDFELYGIVDGRRRIYRLNHTLRENNLVLLMFYPMDFSPVCTTELCSIRDADWFTTFSDLAVWGISADSLYCHRAFSDQYGLNYPILTDSGAEVAGRYGVKYDWWDGHIDVPKRALFLVDTDQRIQYAWSSDDAYVQPDFSPVEEALTEIKSLTTDEPQGAGVDVDYREEHEPRLD